MRSFTNVLTDASGLKKELIEYEPFGLESRHEKYGSSEDVAWYYFTGKPKDDETGLYYFGARYYDPKLGKFIQADPIVAYPGNPQNFNRYSYVHNNPVNLVDPTGNFAWFIPFIIAAAKGALIGAAVGATVAGITGGDVGQGALFGAIGGAAFAGMGSLAQSLVRLASIPGGIGPMTGGASFAADILGGVLGGAGAGAAIASASGGDVGQAAWIGGVSGGAFAVGSRLVGQGINAWLSDQGEFYEINPSNVSASKTIAEAEIIRKYAQSGAKIFVNGIRMSVEEALDKAARRGANILFYNPTHGAVADFAESILGVMTGQGALSSRLGKLMTQLRVDVVGYSQGSIIGSNAMLYAAFNGGAVSGSTFEPIGKAVGMGRIEISARLANVTVIYSNGGTKIFDVIRIVSSELNPLGYVQGAVGLVTTVGFRQHSSY